MADVIHYIEGKPLQERCRIIADYFLEALHQKTPLSVLQQQLPGIFEDIFLSPRSKQCVPAYTG
jgi:hypothetical protein